MSLRSISRENHRSIGITAVTELASIIERINIPPIAAKQRAVADLVGVEAHLHRLLMACGLPTHLPVSGIGDRAAAVTAHRINHPRERLQVMLQTPEAPSSQHRRLLCSQSSQGRAQGQTAAQQNNQQPFHPIT